MSINSFKLLYVLTFNVKSYPKIDFKMPVQFVLILPQKENFVTMFNGKFNLLIIIIVKLQVYLLRSTALDRNQLIEQLIDA